LSRTKGKKTLTIEFDDELFAVLSAIQEHEKTVLGRREKSSMGRVVRLACDAYVIDYLQKHGPLTWIERNEDGTPRVKRTFKSDPPGSFGEEIEFLGPWDTSRKTGWSLPQLDVMKGDRRLADLREQSGNWLQPCATVEPRGISETVNKMFDPDGETREEKEK
jgi:hypothetical protein